jgi:riboflavin synthase
MFTGIVEAIGELTMLSRKGNNLELTIRSPVSHELKIDQSISHNGVCLTVTDIHGETYKVTAVDETLRRSNLGDIKIGDRINLERALKIGDRLDGHLVQGHVDATSELLSVADSNGSFLLTFSLAANYSRYVVEKGSICVNGVSLTVVDAGSETYSIAVIPFTWEHTNLKDLSVGDRVNVEFDIIGKYVEKMMRN